MSLLAAWDRCHHGPEGAEFLRRIFVPTGQRVSKRVERHRRPEPNTQWQFERGAQRAYRLS